VNVSVYIVAIFRVIHACSVFVAVSISAVIAAQSKAKQNIGAGIMPRCPSQELSCDYLYALRASRTTCISSIDAHQI